MRKEKTESEEERKKERKKEHDVFGSKLVFLTGAPKP